MALRRSVVIFGVTGIVLVAVGAAFEPVAGPMVSKMPSNLDMTVHYSGTASLIDQTAVAKGDLLGAFKNGVPMTLDRHIHVTSTSGNTAIVADDQTLNITGMPPLPDDHVYAIDRKTLEAGPAPAGKSADPASGIPIGWPLSPGKSHQYKYYDPTTQSASDFTYTGSGTVRGRGVLEFHTAAQPSPVKDKTLLATLPTVLPKTVAQALVSSPLKILPKDAAALLTPQTVAALPDQIPLSYTAATTADGGADKATGFPIDQHLQQKVILNIALPGQAPISLLPVLSMDFKLTDDSQKYLVDKSKTAALQLTVVKIVVPIVLVAIGLVLLVVAFSKRKPKVVGAAAVGGVGGGTGDGATGAAGAAGVATGESGDESTEGTEAVDE